MTQRLLYNSRPSTADPLKVRRTRGGVAELVDAADLKFADDSRTGSIPVTATTSAELRARHGTSPRTWR
jgi:hypothetical protein